MQSKNLNPIDRLRANFFNSRKEAGRAYDEHKRKNRQTLMINSHDVLVVKPMNLKETK